MNHTPVSCLNFVTSQPQILTFQNFFLFSLKCCNHQLHTELYLPQTPDTSDSKSYSTHLSQHSLLPCKKESIQMCFPVSDDASHHAIPFSACLLFATFNLSYMPPISPSLHWHWKPSTTHPWARVVPRKETGGKAPAQVNFNLSIFPPHSLCCSQDKRKQVPVKK